VKVLEEKCFKLYILPANMNKFESGNEVVESNVF
jgi:NADPH-dependent 7-cyano-7-deazaguanine reductase QueF-like protein